MSQLKKLFKKESKKVLALLLAIALLLSFHPGFVFASPNCGLEEHTHGTDCFVLDCDLDDEDHQHDEYCYDLVCKKPTHTHSEDCETGESRIYTDLQTIDFENGVAKEFNIRVIANDNEGKDVVLTCEFDKPELVEKFELYVPETDQWIELNPAESTVLEFKLIDTEQKLRVVFSEDGYFYFTTAVVLAETQETLCSSNAWANVYLREYNIIDETPEDSKGSLYFPNKVEEGSSAYIEIETELPYALKTLFVNGEDVTNDVVDMEYLIEDIRSDTVIKAEFGLFADNIIVIDSIDFEIDAPEIGKPMPMTANTVTATPEIEIENTGILYWEQSETNSDLDSDAWAGSDFLASFEPNLYYCVQIDLSLPENVYIDRKDFKATINGEVVGQDDLHVINHEENNCGSVLVRKIFDPLANTDTPVKPEEPVEPIVISKIDINVNAPTTDKTISSFVNEISFDKEIPINRQHVLISWQESDTAIADENDDFMDYNEKFKDGKYYHLWMSFDLPSGYVWAENVEAKINGVAFTDLTCGTATENSNAFFFAIQLFDNLANNNPSTPEQPDTPDTPDVPDTPENPDTPDNPTEPPEPENPTDPEKPTEPDGPQNPDTPEQPSDPDIPQEPSNPEDPNKPTEPSEPTEPSGPSQPSEPSEPSDPSEPSEPSDPSDPETPSDPTPDNPENPDAPEKPDSPTDPSNPDEPSNPESPTNPSEPAEPSDPDAPTEPEKPSEHKHTLTKIAAQKAQCTKKGNIEYFVCDCGKWFSDAEGKNEITDKSSVEIAEAGHKASDKLSCDNNSHWHKCTVCGAVADKKVSHNFDEAGKICQTCQYDVDNPKTGDDFNAGLMIALMILSFTGLVGSISYVLYDNKRNNRR